MAKEVDLQALAQEHGARAAHAAIFASQTVPNEEHMEDCPRRGGYSADCVYPFVACVPDDWTFNG